MYSRERLFRMWMHFGDCILTVITTHHYYSQSLLHRGLFRMWMHLGDCILTVITTHDLVCVHVPLFPRKKRRKKKEKSCVHIRCSHCCTRPGLRARFLSFLFMLLFFCVSCTQPRLHAARLRAAQVYVDTLQVCFDTL